MWNRKSIGVIALTTLTALLLVLMPNGPVERRIYAQQIGAAYPPGFSAVASNLSAFQPVLGSNAGALSVTNPAANGIINIAAGGAYCFNGAYDQVGQSQINLVLPGSGTTTYLVVYNCVSNFIYAKTAVVAPGGQAPGNSPGTPGTFLAAIPNVEVPLATVVCNTVACGNGANGSITDARPAANFTQSHVNFAGNAASNKDTIGTATLVAGTVTVTFANAYASAPVCVANKQSGTVTGVVGAATTTTTVVLSSTVGTDSGVVAYYCAGNPN